ncbi:MAG: hypothetical protein KDF65_05105 [Anaerolineae bacterium]|nr:hypothetical protein [Anaerolineae bacterium]
MQSIPARLKRRYNCFLIWLGAAVPEGGYDTPGKPVQAGGLFDKTAWQAHLEAQLPPPTSHIARNAAITRFYAAWYLSQPDLFKWAGMAAFASHRVGFFLIEGDLDRDVQLMRDTNNQVFADIGWAHLAYETGGWPALAAAIAADSENDHRLLRAGFELIHAGEQQLKNKPQSEAQRQKAQALIWRGNLLLLKQEQALTVQKSFTDFSHKFKLSLDSLGWATTLDFDANNLKVDRTSRASFEAYQRESNVALDFSKFEDRWAWVISEALPQWQAVEATTARHILRSLLYCQAASWQMRLVNRLKTRLSPTLSTEIDLMLNTAAVLGLVQRIYEVMLTIATDILLKWVLLPRR